MHSRLLSLGLLILIAFSSNAQRFPDEMKLSPDGHRQITGNQPYTGFYEQQVIHDIFLDFYDHHYWDKLEDNYGDNDFIMATMTVDGVVYDSVGVRFKGSSSYTASNSEKKSFAISLDEYVPDQAIDGYNTLNLNNGEGDPSFMAEILFETQISKHVPAPKGNFVHLFIEGDDWGLYGNVQQLNRDFTKEWFLNNDGALWRAARPEGSPAPHGTDGDSLRSLYNLGTSTQAYMDNYDLKYSGISNPYQKLKALCIAMDTVASSRMESVLSNYLDIDQALWFIASENAFADGDGYVIEAKGDYYIYYDQATNRIVPLEMDGNDAFDDNKTHMSIFENANKPNYALTHKLLNQPQLRQRYLAHMRTLVEDELNPATIFPMINNFYTMVDRIVHDDPVRNYSYQDFLDHKDVLRDFVTDRRASILNNSEIDEDLPEISNTYFFTDSGMWKRPAANEDTYVNTEATSPDDIYRVYLYYSTALAGKFTKIRMYDDGQHNDQAANDDIYGATIAGRDGGTWMRFYVEAVSNNSHKTVVYDPPGAEHDVFTYLVNPERASDTSVVINEIMAENRHTVADSAGEHDDWIELYNNSNSDVDLSGYFLSDDPDNFMKWEFSAGSVIPANGYLVVWADDQKEQGQFHTNFRLNAAGGIVYLFNSDIELVDSLSVPLINHDVSFARIPNGTGPFLAMPATFNLNNNPQPHAAFSTIDTIGCSPFAVRFSNNSVDATEFTWDFGDGNISTDFAPVHIYNTPGNYNVMLTSSVLGFSDIDSLETSIMALAPPAFDFGFDTVIAPGVAYQLNAMNGFSSYLWNTGESTSGILADNTGSYCVTVTDTNSCENSDCVYVITNTTGVNDITGNSFNIFPNPANNYLMIRSNEKNKMPVNVFNSLGQNIFSSGFSNNVSIETSGWPDGIYFLRVGDQKKSVIIHH